MASITQQHGKYLARVRITGHKPISSTFNSRKAALAWAAQVEDEVRRGIFRSADTVQVPSLGKALKDYAERVTPLKRGAPQERNLIGLLLRLPLCSRPLDQVERSDIARLRDHWLAQGLSTSTLQKRLALFSHLYNVARRDWGLEVSNPVNDVTKPEVRNRRERVVPDAELEAVLVGATFTLDRISRLARESAARLGELAALTWPDVDLKASTMTFPVTKNGSARTVPLTPAALELLTAMKPKGVARGSVFGTSSGTVSHAWVLAVRRARRAYEEDCKEHRRRPSQNYLRDLHFHDLRHTAITRLAEHGLSTLELASISGHKSLNMHSRYTHISAAKLAAKLAALDGATA
jgi:integrase